MGSISPITQPKGGRLDARELRDSAEAAEVEDDHHFMSRLVRVSTEDVEISEEEGGDDDLEDSLDEDYEGRKTEGRSTSQSLQQVVCRHHDMQSCNVDVQSHDFEVEEDGDMYDEDFEEEEDEGSHLDHAGDDEEEEEEVSFRPARWGAEPSVLRQTPEKQKVSVPMAVIDSSPIEAVTVPSVKRTASASGELTSLSAQYRESTTREKAIMRDRLEDSVVRGVADSKQSGGVRSSQDSKSTGGSKGVSECSTVSGNAEGSSMTDAIASRLSSLSVDQQRQLLMMLNNLEGSPVVAATPPVKIAPASPQRTKPSPVDTSSSGYSAVVATDGDRTGTPPDTPSRSKKRRSPRRKKNSPARPVSGSDKSRSLVPHQGPSAEASTPDCAAKEGSEVSLRIKLHNSWRKTKFASLASLRLLVRGTDEEVDLSQFSVQVSTGNTFHPKTSEVVRGVSCMFVRSRVAERKEWKFPVGSSTQLVLTGFLTGVLCVVMIMIVRLSYISLQVLLKTMSFWCGMEAQMSHVRPCKTLTYTPIMHLCGLACLRTTVCAHLLTTPCRLREAVPTFEPTKFTRLACY
jgi:hypothetical protein